MTTIDAEVHIPTAEGVALHAHLGVPEQPLAAIAFARAPGQSCRCPFDRKLARALQQAGLATLLVDLLTDEEDRAQRWERYLPFDIGLLTDRLQAVTEWADRCMLGLPIGYFAEGTGSAAAIAAAARCPGQVRAIVSRCGRPDLASDALERVVAPTLLIVSSLDEPGFELNALAFGRLSSHDGLHVIPGADQSLTDPAAHAEVARIAIDWFLRYLLPPPKVVPPLLELPN